MKVRNKSDNTIVDISELLFQRNKKFFEKVIYEKNPEEVVKSFSIEDYKKSEIVDFIVEKLDFTINDLQDFKKSELVEIYNKGEI